MSRFQHPRVYCLELLPETANTAVAPLQLRRILAASRDAAVFLASRPAAALVRAQWLQVAVRLLDVAAGEAEAVEQKTAVTSR